MGHVGVRLPVASVREYVFTFFSHFKKHDFLRFLPRDALVHSAVLRLHVVRLSVCLSVRL